MHSRIPGFPHLGHATTGLLLIAALATQPLVAHAQDDGTHGMVVQSVTGAAHWQTPDGFYRRLTFNARKYADSYVGGEWQMVAGSAILHGTITCLNILSPNEARIGGTVDEALFTLFQAGTDIGWVVVDNGQGADAPLDMTSNLRAFRNAPPGSAERFCETGELPFGGGDLAIESVTHGNSQIHL